jgi:hypothetical protein
LKLVALERRAMITMKFTIELDIGLSFLLWAAPPQLVTDRDATVETRAPSSFALSAADSTFAR